LKIFFLFKFALFTGSIEMALDRSHERSFIFEVKIMDLFFVELNFALLIHLNRNAISSKLNPKGSKLVTFHHHHFSFSKSDVWAFAIVLWEIGTLGE
jgi:hypothetical protein